jgi:hypothetical protein
VPEIAARYQAKIETPDGLRTCYEARIPADGDKDPVARFAGIPAAAEPGGVHHRPVSVLMPTPRKGLIYRLGRRSCELCGRHATVAVHQVARLARLGMSGPGQPARAAAMASKRHKTLVVCQPCRAAIRATPVAHAA